MKKLCVIIPTRNRSDCINYYLEEVVNKSSVKEIDYVIWDSSDNAETKQIVENFRKNGFENVFYEFYDEVLEENAIDWKVYYAAKKYSKLYEYINFSSDATIIDYDVLLPKINYFMKEQYQLIVFDREKLLDFDLRKYSDSCVLLKECCWRMTCLSATIVSGEFLCRVLSTSPMSSVGFPGFWLPMAYFDALKGDRCKAVYVVEQNSWYPNRYLKDSFWKTSGDLLWQWGKIWSEAIYSLPRQYNCIKKEVILSLDQYTGMFSIKHLVSSQRWENITIKKIKKYKEYIKSVTKTDIVIFYLIAIFVRKETAVILYEIYQKIKVWRKRK